MEEKLCGVGSLWIKITMRKSDKTIEMNELTPWNENLAHFTLEQLVIWHEFSACFCILFPSVQFIILCNVYCLYHFKINQLLGLACQMGDHDHIMTTARKWINRCRSNMGFTRETSFIDLVSHNLKYDLLGLLRII